MKVTLAKTAGFCPAVDMAYKAAGCGRVYTYGPIIHNEAVVGDLASKGVFAVESVDDIPAGADVTVVLRSHGVSRATYEAIAEKGVNIIDATCPFVKKIHHIVEEKGREGREIIIIGDAKHPEVQAICGWCQMTPTVIENRDEAEKFVPKHTEKLCIVSQTTFNYKKFQELVEILSKKGYDILCLNTICNATEERQSEARRIAGFADAMIVIGGQNSSNTQKLYEISKEECENTYYIQALGDLDFSKLESVDNVGITAGASTPNNIIEEVHKACQK